MADLSPMRWWGWGDPHHHAELPASRARGAARGARRARSHGRAGGAGGRGDGGARAEDAGTRAAARCGRRGMGAPGQALTGHARGRQGLPRPGATPRRSAGERARRGRVPGKRRRGAGGPRRMRRGGCRGDPVRRRHQRRRRGRAPAGGDGRRDLPRPRPDRPRAPGRHPLADRRARRRPARARGRARARAGGPHAGPLPAVVGVRHAGRMGRHPLGRPGLDRVRQHRQAGRRAALRLAVGRDRPARPARDGGRTRGCGSCWSDPRACSESSPRPRCGCARCRTRPTTRAGCSGGSSRAPRRSGPWSRDT